MKLNNTPAKRLLWNALGLFCSVIPVAVSIFSYFPIWVAREDASVLSGLSLMLIAMALVPFFRYVRAALASASAPLMWFIIFAVFLLLSKIADEMTVIAFVGFVSNLLGAVFFRIARVSKDE